MTLTGTKTTYQTSDGKAFETEAEARAHAKDASVTVTVTGQKTAYVTSDGKSFASQAEADKHADESKLTVSAKTTFTTSDGKSFDSQSDAARHAKDASVTVTVSGSKVETVEHPAQTHEEAVEETGHWELAATSATEGGAKPETKPESKPSDGGESATGGQQQATQKQPGDKAQAASDEEAEPVALAADAHAKAQQAKALPQTGDNETRIGVVTAAALGSVAVFGVAAHLRRRGL